MIRPLPLLLLAVAVCAADFALPRKWPGGADGSGNPATVDGQPRWRLDAQVGDQLSASGWKPMKWFADKTRWAGSDGGSALFNSKGAFLLRMGGGDEKHPSAAALVFIAPTAGTWILQGSVSASAWEKATAPDKLRVLKRAKGADVLEQIAEPPSQGEILVEATLAEGDELVLTAGPLGRRRECNVSLAGLHISCK